MIGMLLKFAPNLFGAVASRVSGLWLVALLAAAAGAGAGWYVTDLFAERAAHTLRETVAELRVTIAGMERDQARVLFSQAEAASLALYAAHKRGDALSRALLGAESTRQTLQEERDEALRRVTTGRRCLDGDALRLLDGARRATPARAAHLPAAAGGAVAAGGPAAAAAPGDQPGDIYATDTGLALWISHAQSSHDTCRERLDALIDWHAGAAQ